METRGCPVCDEPVAADAQFCPQCGNTGFPWQDEEDRGALGGLLFFLALLVALQGDGCCC